MITTLEVLPSAVKKYFSKNLLKKQKRIMRPRGLISLMYRGKFTPWIEVKVGKHGKDCKWVKNPNPLVNPGQDSCIISAPYKKKWFKKFNKRKYINGR